MLSSCPAPPAAGQQFITENRTGSAGGDCGGDLTAVRAGHGALIEYLDQVVDHRSRQGLRYELGFLLAVVVAATACAGHDEVAAQAQWAADAPVGVLRALGTKPDPLTSMISTPSEATLRRALAKVDTAELQRMSTEWTQALRASASDGESDGESAGLPAVAIDGKSVRGAAAGGNPRPHLLSAATHDGAIVIAQRQIPETRAARSVSSPPWSPSWTWPAPWSRSMRYADRHNASHVMSRRPRRRCDLQIDPVGHQAWPASPPAHRQRHESAFGHCGSGSSQLIRTPLPYSGVH